MKTLILLVMSFLLVTACDDATTTNNNTNVKQVTALINGQKFTATNMIITEDAGTHQQTVRVLGENGSDTLIMQIFFEPNDTLRIGTYSFAKVGSHLAIYKHSGITDTASEGSLKIEKFVGPNPIKTSGTFNFVIKNNNNTIYSITNGVFNSGD